MIKTKPTLYTRLGGLASALALASVLGSAQASITMVDYTEDDLSFSAKYAFTPDLSTPDLESNLGSWETLLTQTYEPAVSGVSPETWTFVWEGAHVPLSLTALGSCSITAGQTGTFCDTTTQVPHAPGGDSDEYRFWLELTDSSGYAYFTGAHVSAVPVPAAAWLFGSGLMGLIGIARRRKAAT